MEEAPNVLMKRHPSFMAYYRWKSTSSDIIINNHYKQQKVNRMISLLVHHRGIVSHIGLTKWRDSIHLKYSKKRKISALFKMLKIKYEASLKNRFYRWKAVSLELENNIQMRAVANRYTLKTYLGGLFSAWRTVCTDMKNKRRAKLSRTWKTLRAYVLK